MIALAAALLSALFFYLSQGLDDVWPLAWLAPAPVLWLAYGETPLWRVIAAAVFAFLCGQIYAVQCYGAMPLLILSALAPAVALFVAVVVFARWTRRRTGPWLTWLAFPVAWTAAEYLSGAVMPNGTFGALGYSQMPAPLLIQSVKPAGGPEQKLAAQDRGKLPMSPDIRAAILDGLRRVASTPQGTAYYAFSGEMVATAAKTGSAENENPDAHAWFVGFQTPADPRLVVLVMIEGGQHGSTVAAPLGRQLLDAVYPKVQ